MKDFTKHIDRANESLYSYVTEGSSRTTKNKPCRIKYDGEYMSLLNGKTVWPNIKACRASINQWVERFFDHWHEDNNAEQLTQDERLALKSAMKASLYLRIVLLEEKN